MHRFDRRALLALALITSLVPVLGCGPCEITNEQVLTGLAGGRQVVAYISNCGATSDYTANVSFYSADDDLGQERGSIFFADHARGVRLESHAPDTVKVIYAAERIIRQKAKVEGITFIYERNWHAF